MPQEKPRRWSDEELEEFHQEFRAHVEAEAEERIQQRALYVALFQKEDKDTNTPAGLLQLTSRMDTRLSNMEIANDRQKRFIGGFLFAFSCVAFFFTETAHSIVAFLKKL